jgi:hypothetical protein
VIRRVNVLTEHMNIKKGQSVETGPRFKPETPSECEAPVFDAYLVYVNSRNYIGYIIAMVAEPENATPLISETPNTTGL